QEPPQGRRLHACTPIQPSAWSPSSRAKQATVAPPSHSHARRALLNVNASVIVATQTGKAIITQGSVVTLGSPGHARAARPISAMLKGSPSRAAARYLAHMVVSLPRDPPGIQVRQQHHHQHERGERGEYAGPRPERPDGGRRGKPGGGP